MAVSYRNGTWIWNSLQCRVAALPRFELLTLRSIALLMNSDSEFHGSEFQSLLISTSQLR